MKDKLNLGNAEKSHCTMKNEDYTYCLTVSCCGKICCHKDTGMLWYNVHHHRNQVHNPTISNRCSWDKKLQIITKPNSPERHLKNIYIVKETKRVNYDISTQLQTLWTAEAYEAIRRGQDTSKFTISNLNKDTLLWRWWSKLL